MESGDEALASLTTNLSNGDESLTLSSTTKPHPQDDAASAIKILRSDVDVLRTEVDILRAEKLEMEILLDEARRDREAIAAEASRLEGVIVRLQEDLTAASDAADDYAIQVQLKRQDVDSIAAAKAALEAEMRNLEGKLAAAEEKAAEVAVLKDQLLAAEGKVEEIEDLKEEALKLTAKEAELERALLDLQGTNAALEVEIASKRGAVVVAAEYPNVPWTSTAIAASAGATFAVAVMAVYLRLRR